MCALVSSLQRNDERGGHLISSHRLLGRHECGGVMNDARLRVAPFRVTRVVLHAVWTNRAACHVCVVRHLWVTGRRAHGRYKMRRVKVRMDPIRLDTHPSTRRTPPPRGTRVLVKTVSRSSSDYVV